MEPLAKESLTSFKRIAVNLLLKVPLLGFAAILIPAFILGAILQWFDSSLFHSHFTVNDKLLGGLPLFVVTILLGPLTSVALAFFLWPFLTLGLWIYSKFRSL